MFIFAINLEYLRSIFSNETCSRNKCHSELGAINLKDEKMVYFKVFVFYRQEYSPFFLSKRIVLLLTFPLSF